MTDWFEQFWSWVEIYRYIYKPILLYRYIQIHTDTDKNKGIYNIISYYLDLLSSSRPSKYHELSKILRRKLQIAQLVDRVAGWSSSWIYLLQVGCLIHHHHWLGFWRIHGHWQAWNPVLDVSRCWSWCHKWGSMLDKNVYLNCCLGPCHSDGWVFCNKLSIR